MRFIILFSFLSLIIHANGQNDQKRLALIIGNSNYPNKSIKNAVNDVMMLGEELWRNGFEVMVYTNLTSNEMKIRIEEFGVKLKESKGIGLFFYSGHAMQFNDENYLIPLDAKIEKEQDIELEAINLSRVFNEMQNTQNSLNILILDASCQNTYNKVVKTKKAGLASIVAPIDSFVAFSSMPGYSLPDLDENNSLYVLELVNALEIENIKIEQVFKNVRIQVYKKTDGKQSTWENSSLLNDFYFSK